MIRRYLSGFVALNTGLSRPPTIVTLHSIIGVHPSRSVHTSYLIAKSFEYFAAFFLGADLLRLAAILVGFDLNVDISYEPGTVGERDVVDS